MTEWDAYVQPIVPALPTTHMWPPLLADLKNDMRVPLDHTEDDIIMQNELSAAVAYVQRVRPTFNYTGDITLRGPLPSDDLWEGTLSLAARWVTRHRSPDGMVTMADMGATKIAVIDPDIERKLGIGRFQGPVTA